MTHEELRRHHFARLNDYRHSAEYAAYAGLIGGEVLQGELPSLIGNRWEIDRQIYDEFLEMLPPLEWEGDSFFMREFTFGNITAKYTKEGDKYYCEFARFRAKRVPDHKPAETPWGVAQSSKEYAPGIVFHSTASHGGFHLSDERVAKMPPYFREFKPFAGANWYEEDADWSIVALAFPEYFPAGAFQAALETLKHYKPELYEEIASRRSDSHILSNERLQAIWDELTQAGKHSIADELRGHFAALTEQFEGRVQYYEEFLIPEIEGRRVGKWSGSVRQAENRAR